MEDQDKKAPTKLGRPTKRVKAEDIVDEQGQERLDMSKKDDIISIDDLGNRWKATFAKIAQLDGTSGIGTVAEKWNKLNPFLQNQRIKNLYTTAKTYSKANISEFLQNPANNEKQLRSLAWANSSSQQIYYNILRRSCDVPLYNYFVVPDILDAVSVYKKEDFKAEDALVQNWLETFNVANTFKTIAMEVKREGKSSYLLRSKFSGVGKEKRTEFCTLQKMPTDWVKITGKGQLGFTISFDMMYFLNISNSPSDFGDFMVSAWEDMLAKGIVTIPDGSTNRSLNLAAARDYSFTYEGKIYNSSIETLRKGSQINYMFWLRMPFDMCYTFGSDNSTPWVVPDTMGLMLKLQELTDYGQLAGLIASTPLTAVLTGEIETIDQPRAGKNESVYSPEVLQGYMQQFNQATSTNVEAWLWPAKNIKLQQLASDVNSSDIITTATENFVESAGEGGLTITDTKPNVAMVKTAQALSAAQQNYVTLQFEAVLNYILQHKLGFKYRWKTHLWGDIFSIDSEKGFLKEAVASGNIALLPKLMSSEGISIRDTKAIVEYIKSFDFYKDFVTYTQESGQRFAESKQTDNTAAESTGKVGRPALADSDIENENTAASRDQGTNTADNRY